MKRRTWSPIIFLAFLVLILVIEGQGCLQDRPHDLSDSNGGGYGGMTASPGADYGNNPPADGVANQPEQTNQPKTGAAQATLANSFVHFPILELGLPTATLFNISHWADEFIFEDAAGSGNFWSQNIVTDKQAYAVAYTQIQRVGYNPDYMIVQNKIFRFINTLLAETPTSVDKITEVLVLCRKIYSGSVPHSSSVTGLDVLLLRRGGKLFVQIFQGLDNKNGSYLSSYSTAEIPAEVYRTDLEFTITGSDIKLVFPVRQGEFTNGNVSVHFIDSFLKSDISCLNEKL